jgi:hypothetical protein
LYFFMAIGNQLDFHPIIDRGPFLNGIKCHVMRFSLDPCNSSTLPRDIVPANPQVVS